MGCLLVYAYLYIYTMEAVHVQAVTNTENEEDQKTKKRKNTEPRNMDPKTWPVLLQQMDAKGPPIKKVITRKPKLEKKEVKAKPLPPWLDYFTPPDCFDINKHGYWMRGRDLIYKTPDGQTFPATGCDTFGPFKDAPLRQWNNFKPKFNK